MITETQNQVGRERIYDLRFLGLGISIGGMFYKTWQSEAGRSSTESILSGCDSLGVFDARKHFPECEKNFSEQKDRLGEVNFVAYSVYNRGENAPRSHPVMSSRTNYETEKITFEEFLRLGSPRELIKEEKIRIEVQKE